MFSAVVLSAAAVATVTQVEKHAIQEADYRVIKAATWSYKDPGLDFSTGFSPKYNTSYFLSIVSNPAPYFHVYYPELADGTCGGYQKPSQRARNEHCLFATNGSPFVMGKNSTDKTCIGAAVSDGRVGANDPTSYPAFGLTSKAEFVLGALTPTDVHNMGFEQLLTGFGWLVKDGTVVGNSGKEIAPRTAIGVDQAGRLLLFEADGIERSDIGLTLQQTAEWLQSLGFYHALNLDGGGSSTVWYNNTVVNHPTSTDTGAWVERPVTTVPCVVGTDHY